MSKYQLPYSAEIELEVDRPNTFQIDGSEEWQADVVWGAYYEADQLKMTSLAPIEKIKEEWYESLTEEERQNILKKNKIPSALVSKEWMKFWRTVAKTAELRDIERAHKSGEKVGTTAHYWTIWITENFYGNLDEIEKKVVNLNDDGLSHAEIGFQMIEAYGERFYSPRKGENKGTTTPAKIVNYFFSQKIPTKIAKVTLLEYLKWRMEKESIDKKKERAATNRKKFTYNI